MEGVGVVNGLLKVGCVPETLQKDDKASEVKTGESHAEEGKGRYWNACPLSNLDQLLCSPFFRGLPTGIHSGTFLLAYSDMKAKNGVTQLSPMAHNINRRT
jgi:hypothetical protein